MIATCARWVLIFEIFAAPLLLGGGRPWALAILAVPLALTLPIAFFKAQKMGSEQTTGLLSALSPFFLALILAILWLIAQALPVWPQAMIAPFAGNSLALAPAQLPDQVLYLLWLFAMLVLCALQSEAGNEITPLCRALAASAALQAAIAMILDVAAIPSTLWFVKTAHISDFTGTFANRNAFCAFITAGFFACLYMWQRPGGSFREKIDPHGGWLALAILLFIAALGSHSRAGMLALMAGTFVFILQAGGRAERAGGNAFTIRLITAFLALAAMIVSILLTPDLLARFAGLSRPDWLQRDDVWQSALNAIIARPFTGYGAQGIAPALQYAATPGMNDAVRWVSSHNLWLDMVLVLGLPVFLLVLALLVKGGLAVLRGIHHNTTPAKRALFMAVLVAFLVQSGLDGIGELPAVIMPLVILLGCLAPRQKQASKAVTAPDAPQ